MAIQTIVLGPGECAVLPATAEIIAVTPNGAITATSTCDNLPEVSDYRCWRFMWGDVSDAPEYDDAYFTSIKIGDTTYTVNGAPVAEVNSYDNGADFLAEALPVSTPDGLIIDIISGGGEAASPKCLAIQVPEIFGAPVLNWEVPLGGGAIQYSSFAAVADICDCD